MNASNAQGRMSGSSSAQALETVGSRAATQRSTLDVQALSSTSRLIWGMIVAMLVASIVGYRLSGLTFEWWAFDKMGGCIAILLAIAYVYRRFRPDPWVSFGAEGCAQLLLVLTLGAVLSFELATS